MPRRYRDIYPSLPLLNCDDAQHLSASGLMSAQNFQAAPDGQPEDIFTGNHMLLNLNPEQHRVQNYRD